MTIEAYQSYPRRMEPTVIRPISDDDRRALAAIVERAGNFNAEEVVTAIELIDEALRSGNRDYIIHVLEVQDEPRGFVCFGPTPLANGVFDLYWIAVDPAARERGYGKKLMRFAEDEVKRRAGRMMVIETSSLPSYAPSRKLYLRAGYAESARLRDFYKPGDDKLIFTKSL